MKSVNIRIKGSVQGVFFRVYAQKKAKELGLSGWIRNEADGSVYAELEGEEKAVASFIAWAKVGSPAARVEAVEVEPAEWRNLRGFTIRR